MNERRIEMHLSDARAELANRIRDGHENVVEALLSGDPFLAGDLESALELIYLEFVTREDLGHQPRAEEYYDRFPQMRNRIERLLAIHATLSSDEEITRATDSPVTGYRVVRRVGSGGMGTVYVAEQQSVKRLVALKVLHDFVSEDRDVIERFHREAVTLGMLSHPHIASVYASGVENGIHFLAMQYCDGSSLQNLVNKRENSGTGGAQEDSHHEWCDWIIQIGIRIADALSYAHVSGILHRDIKPSNVIVNETTQDVWVIDFGLAKVLDSQEHTLTVGPVGTPGFSSPEQLGGGEIDARTDIYSLGVTLQRLLSVRSEADRSLVWLSTVDEKLVQVISRATESEPELRYPSIEAFRNDLIAVTQGGNPEPRRLLAAHKLVLRLKRHKTQAVVVGVLLVMLVTLGGLFRQEREKTRQVAYQQHIESAVMKLHLVRLLSLVDDAEQRFIHYTRQAKIFDNHGMRDPLQESLENLDRAIALFPRQPEAHYFRAKTLAALARTQDALSALDESLAWDREFVPARILRAQLLGRSTPQLISDIVDSRQDDWLADWTVAESAMSEKRWQDAADAYERLLDSGIDEPYSGGFLDARHMRIEALFGNEEYAAAIEQLAVFRTQFPQMPEPGLLIGKAYLYNRDEARAESVFQKTHASTSLRDMTAIWISVVYHNRDRWTKANEWLRRIENDYVRRIVTIRMLKMQEDIDTSERITRESIELYPHNAPFHQLLSWILKSREQYTEAESAARTAIGLDPSFVDAHVELGSVLVRTGRFGEAQEVFDQCIRLCDTPTINVSIGNQFFRTRDFDKANQYFQNALKLDPNFAIVHFFLGATAEELGHPNDSIDHYLRAVELAPRHAYLHERLGHAYKRTKLWCKAFDAYVNAVAFRSVDVSRDRATESLLFGLTHDGHHRSCGDGSGFHDTCGVGDRLVDVLEEVVANQEDAETLMLLGLAYSTVSSRMDIGKAIAMAHRAVEISPPEAPQMVNYYTRIMKNVRHQTGTSVAAVHSLEYTPSLPPFGVIDALLQDQIVKDPERLVQRFSAVSNDGNSALRLAYLRGRLEQIAGNLSTATDHFRTIIDHGEIEPWSIARLVNCLQAIGDIDAYHALVQRVESESRSTTEAGSALPDNLHHVCQWDFDDGLHASTDGRPLVPDAAPPATTPEYSFQEIEMVGGTARVAHFERGVFFRMAPDFNTSGARNGFTLVLDVCLALESNAFGALLQTSVKNEDDADWSVHPRQGIGSGNYGGEIRPGHWYRLTLVVDPLSDTMLSYINGHCVQQRSVLGIRLHIPDETTKLLFADENGENTSGWINSVQIRNYPMNSLEIALLGGPTAVGIPLPDQAATASHPMRSVAP